jgi:hypothetical protein
MAFRLSALWTRTPADRPAAKYTSGMPRFRPVLEGFEDRIVPAAPVLNAAQVAEVAAVNTNIVVTGVNLTNFQIVDGVLRAAGTVTGTIAGLPFTTQITNFALDLIPDDPATPGVECSVLNLELAPINLALLGLHVDTSAICLEVTATQGGGLLGDLLCGLAGGGLGGLPTLPTAGQLTDLLTGLTTLLNGALGGALIGPGDGSVCTGESEILDLALGPVNLSLLGVNVSLDDCEGGPVQVCVSATRSEGLLGSLLAGLGSTPSANLDLADITQFANAALEALEDGVLSGRDRGQLTSLLAHLRR